MSEKVVHEIRVIETEDGFRIEFKGDKEQLRQMIFDPRSGLMGRRGGRGFGQRRGKQAPMEAERGFGGRGHGPHHHRRGFHPFSGRDLRRRFFAEEHEAPMKGKRGYDLGPWWDQDNTEEPPVTSL